MKVIIAGSRDLTDYTLVERAIQASGFSITEVVSGGCRGVDLLGEEWAKQHHVPVKRFLADWGRLGKSAGPLRNQQMAEYADALIALKLPISKGTQDMITRAKQQKLKVYVVAVK